MIDALLKILFHYTIPHGPLDQQKNWIPIETDTIPCETFLPATLVKISDGGWRLLLGRWIEFLDDNQIPHYNSLLWIERIPRSIRHGKPIKRGFLVQGIIPPRKGQLSLGLESYSNQMVNLDVRVRYERW